jgi:hypothetical protein
MSWKIWKERNARVFQNNASTAIMVILKTKDEVATWSMAAVKALSNVLPRELVFSFWVGLSAKFGNVKYLKLFYQ